MTPWAVVVVLEGAAPINKMGLLLWIGWNDNFHLNRFFCCTKSVSGHCNAHHSISSLVLSTQDNHAHCGCLVVSPQRLFPNLWTPKHYNLTISKFPLIPCPNLQSRARDLSVSILLQCSHWLPLRSQMLGGHPPSGKTVQPHPKSWCLCSKSSSDFRSSSSLPRTLVHISCHHCTLVVQNLVVWFFIRLNQISKPDDLLLWEEQAQGKI